jgi:hypothetical protein
MREWKPIETAPKAELNGKEMAGPRILVWDGDHISVAVWEIINKDRTTGWWRYQAGAGPAEFSDYGLAPVCDNPTHWMPLPSPPTNQEHGEG